MQWDLYPVFDVAPGPPRNGPCTDHARGGPSGCPRGRLGTLAGIAHRIYKAENLVAPKGDVPLLTGAASIWTTERLLRMWSAPPVEPLPDLSWLSRAPAA